VIGAACAYELSARGASVILFERDHLAAHASGRNQGLWVLPDHDGDVPMALASLDDYRGVAADAPLDVRLDDEPVGSGLLLGGVLVLGGVYVGALRRTHDEA